MFALVHLHFIRRGRTNEQLGKRVKRKDAGMAKCVNVFGRFCIERISHKDFVPASKNSTKLMRLTHVWSILC